MKTAFQIPDRPATEERPYRILFVCLGNICRSPTAEGMMQHLVHEAGLDHYIEIDSAGTSAWHAGEPANSKSKRVAAAHGVALRSRARQIDIRDLDYYDLLIAMDNENYDNLLRLSDTEEQKARICKLREFDPKPEDGQVPDPYFGGPEGFENVYQIVKRSCQHLLDTLRQQIK